MRLLTIEEFDTMKMYELPNGIYNTIEREMIKTLPETIVKKIMLKFLSKTVREFSCNSYVNIMNCFQLI
jgi:hypothetical protein